MIRISGKIWQGLGAWSVVVAVGLLGGWWWRATVSVVGAQESSPFAGMVEVPGGQFIMGRDGGPTNEQPAHQTFLPTFARLQSLRSSRLAKSGGSGL
jgi:formylglycine-generating enzyme required for sulfatase activity